MDKVTVFWKFVEQFTDQRFEVVCIDGRVFIDEAGLAAFTQCIPVWGGLFLGVIEADMFKPSFQLLSLLSGCTKEQVVVTKDGEIEFLYGRHLRKRHIQEVYGKKMNNSLKLVQNDLDENLGLGRWVMREDSTRRVHHVLDRGVFLKWDEGKAGGPRSSRGKHL